MKHKKNIIGIIIILTLMISGYYYIFSAKNNRVNDDSNTKLQRNHKEILNNNQKFAENKKIEPLIQSKKLRTVPKKIKNKMKSSGIDSSWQFTKADIKEYQSRTITVDLGDYDIKLNNQFTVEIKMSSPALTNFLLVLEYDKKLLKPIQNSGKAVGKIFRKGIEFYIDTKEPRIAILCDTFPSFKNVLSTDGEIVVEFKMLAIAEGETQLKVAPKGFRTTNAMGESQDHLLQGGKIYISEN